MDVLRAHNPEVVGSNPVPAISKMKKGQQAKKQKLVLLSFSTWF